MATAALKSQRMISLKCINHDRERYKVVIYFVCVCCLSLELELNWWFVMKQIIIRESIELFELVRRFFLPVSYSLALSTFFHRHTQSNHHYSVFTIYTYIQWSNAAMRRHGVHCLLILLYFFLLRIHIFHFFSMLSLDIFSI